MGSRTIALACASVLSVASSVSAQSPSTTDSLTPLQRAVACASPPILATDPPDALHIVGSQDVVSRSAFGTPEVLVLSGGLDHQVKVNDLYFVRRVKRGAETLNDKLPHTVLTIGWVRIVSANQKMALASPEHTCSEMRLGDYLEPFVPPAALEMSATEPLVQSELNFDSYARVLHGEWDRGSIGPNEFATLDHGLDRNIRVGTRFAVYRDLQLAQNPLKRIGEAIAVMVGPQLTVVRVTSARDALFIGDVMVPRTADNVAGPPPPPSINDVIPGPNPNLLSVCRGGRVPPQSPQCAGSEPR